MSEEKVVVTENEEVMASVMHDENDPVVSTKYIQQKNKQTIKGHAPEWLQQHYKAVKLNQSQLHT